MSERNWQEDVDMMEGTDEFEWTNYQELQIQMGEALPYWLQEIKSLREQLATETKRADDAEALLEAAEMLFNDPDGIEKEVMSMARAQQG